MLESNKTASRRRIHSLVVDLPNYQPNANMTTDQLIQQLVTEGGAIVTSGECSEMEIADAQATGRFSVREDGIGFVRRYAEWLALQLEREEAGRDYAQDQTTESILAKSRENAILAGDLLSENRKLKCEIESTKAKLSTKCQTVTIAEGTIREQRHRIESLEADNLIYSTQRKKDQASTARFAEAMTLLRREENAESMVARLREILLHNSQSSNP